MLNISNSYQQHSVWMQELEVTLSQRRWNTTRLTWTRHTWMRRTGRKLATSTHPRCLPNGALRTWMETCAPAFHSSIRSNYAWMLEHLRSPHGIEVLQHWDSAELDEWRLSCKGSYWVCYWSRIIMNLRRWYIRRKDTRIFTIVYCIRMLQLS